MDKSKHLIASTLSQITPSSYQTLTTSNFPAEKIPRLTLNSNMLLPQSK